VYDNLTLSMSSQNKTSVLERRSTCDKPVLCGSGAKVIFLTYPIIHFCLTPGWSMEHQMGVPLKDSWVD